MAALTARQVVDAQTSALIDARRGDVTSIRADDEALDGQMLFAHGCRVPNLITAFKVGALEPRNTSRSLPSVQASVLLHDPDSGVPVALLDGAAITVLRTAGGLVAGLELLGGDRLAGPLAILGAGPQGQMVARLAREALGVEDIRVWSPKFGPWTSVEVTRAPSAEAALRGAPMVACCTNSSIPVVEQGWLHAKALVATLGSYAPDRCEVPVGVTLASELVVIDQEAARLEAGPVVAGLAEGLQSERVVELVDLPVGERVRDGLVTFHCKGLGIQDAYAAAAVYFEWPEFERRVRSSGA
ncbi:hypothetical protein [Mariniluteicoccus flavus]